MDSITDKLGQLKEKVFAADDLSSAYSFFFDHLGNNPSFMQRGKRAKHEIITAVLKTMCNDIFGDKSKVTNVKLFNAAKTSFFHGICQMNSKPASVLYFEDIEMGMIAIMAGPAFGQFTYVRFSATSVEPKDTSKFVVPERKTLQ